MKRTALLFSFFLTQICAWSQTDTIDLTPVEVKAVRAGERSPFTKTNITKAEIQKQNLGQDLPFMLNQVPSVVVNSDAGNGIGYTGIRIRGTDATRINVTLNGVPFNDAESQGTFFVNLPDFLSSVNSIQVQRGVGTSSNGGGSFGGGIHLSTNEINKESYLELNNSYGSFNSFKNTIKVGTGLLGDHFTTDIRLSNITSDGYVDRASSDLKSYYLSSAYIADNTSLRLNIFSGKEKTYQSWYGVSEGDLETNRRSNSAGSERPGAPYDNETDNYKQNHYQLFFNQKLKSNLTFNTGIFYVKGKGYYEQYKANEAYADYGIANPIFGSETITETDLVRQLWLDNDYYGNIFSLQHSSPKTEFIFGGSFAKYKGKHFGDVVWASKGLPNEKTRWYFNNAEKNDATVYAKWQQNISPAFQLFTDLQLRKVNYELNGFRNSPSVKNKNDYTFFNPKAGINYRINNWMTYASFGIANKEPNRDDFEAGADEQPKPEQLQDIELGIEKKNKNYNLGATIFYMKYKDQLVLTGKINDVGAYTRTNIEDSYRTGIELQAGVILNKWLQANANISFSRNRVQNFKEYIDDYDNGGQKINNYKEEDIAFSPNVIGAATITLSPVKELEINLLSKYVGDQFLDNTSNEKRKLNAYFTQDVRTSYSFSKKAFKNISLIAGVNNVFNSLYEPNGYTFSYYYNNELATENYYFPMAGINWIAGLNMKF